MTSTGRLRRLIDRIPDPLGPTRRLANDPLGALLDWMHEHPRVAPIRLGLDRAFIVFEPELVGYVLRTNRENYVKENRGYRTLRFFMGESVFTTDSAQWSRKRSVVRQAFTREAARAWGPLITGVLEPTIERWARFAGDGAVVDISEEMIRVTMRVISSALFGRDMAEHTEAIASATADFQHAWHRIVTAPFVLPDALPSPTRRRLRAARQCIEDRLLVMVEERRRDPGDATDVLSILMSARDPETGAGLTDEELRDEVAALFLAGHESTSHALGWTWYLLSRYPQAARAIREEVHECVGDGPVQMETLPGLKYTGAVVKEAMRLFPPVWHFGRIARDDDTLDDHRVPAGSLVMLVPYATHRRPDLWDNPEGFDPARFLDERSKERSTYAYFPFGAGPRACLGGHFAMTELQIVLATLLRRFRVDLVPGRRIETEPLITLRPRHGIPARIHRSRAHQSARRSD